jgi:hypothetical protein
LEERSILGRGLHSPELHRGEGGIMMNLKNVTVQLDASQVQEVLRIDMDGDSEDALSFIKEALVKQVKEALQPH